VVLVPSTAPNGKAESSVRIIVPVDPAGPSSETARLIVFTRYPEPGKTKTRLIERLGAAGASELQREMTAHTLTAARELRSGGGIGVEVRFVGGSEVAMQACFGNDLSYRFQGEGSLGDRMARAIQESLHEEAVPVVIIGSDCPGVTADLLKRAFDLLRRDTALVVVGPARDGGYYLIGMAREAPELFREITWGAEDVLSRTVATARRFGYPLGMLEELEDVDRPEDLDVWYAMRGTSGGR
jgi:uncharacterized protein